MFTKYTLRRKSTYKQVKRVDFKLSIKFLLIALLLLFCTIIMNIYLQFRPVFEKLALNECTYIAITAINDTISNEIYQNQAKYPSLVILEKDIENRVTALSTNMLTINSMKADIINSVNDVVNDLAYKDIYIPLGNLLGSELFTGTGPNISVKILGIGVADADFISVFSTAGINQTRHSIMLSISADLTVVVPGENFETTVETEFVVSETILLGTVPNSFTYIDDQESTLLGKVNDYAE